MGQAGFKPATFYTSSRYGQRRNLKTRINELRDYYGTFMAKHGLIYSKSF